jgi:hypothetical protein
VGTNVGDIGIWEVGSREKLAQRTFKVWDITAASMPMQVRIYASNVLCTGSVGQVLFHNLLMHQMCNQ